MPLADPRVSLIDANLAGLAPLLVLVGGAERLLDEGVELVERARASAVRATLQVAPDMPHNPPALVQFHPNAQRAMTHVYEFVAEIMT